MSSPAKILTIARQSGAQFVLEANRLRLVPSDGKTLDPSLIEAARANREALVAELSKAKRKSCCVCGDSHAPHGVGIDWRDLSKGRWYCTSHNPPRERIAPAPRVVPLDSMQSVEPTKLKLIEQDENGQKFIEMRNITRDEAVRVYLEGWQ